DTIAVNGAPLRTNVSGPVSLTVAATDIAGNTAIEVVVYKVSAGACMVPPPGVIAWLGGDDTAQDEVTGAFAAWQGAPAYAPGKVGRAVVVGNGHSLLLPLMQSQTGPFSVQLWVRT